MDVQRVTQMVSLVVYGALMVIAVRFWWQQREPAARWLVATFAILAAIVCLSAILPEDQDGVMGQALWVPRRILLDAAIIALLAFPYFLHRFARSFADRVPLYGRVLDVGMVAVAVWTVLLPGFPAADDVQPAWIGPYRTFALSWWFVTLMSVTVALWRAGRGQPGVARRRMRSLAVAALMMNAALLGSSLLQDGSGEATTTSLLVTSLLAWTSAAAFWIGFAPPGLLRRLWRAEEEAKLRKAEEGLVTATTRREAASLIVEPAAALLGSQAAVIRDKEGVVLARSGHFLAEQTEASQGLSVVVGTRSRLVVEKSRYMPLFGAEEEGLLRSLGAHLDMALERVMAFEASEAARQQAQRASEELQQLVYGITHDLKNPLHTITGFLDLLGGEANRLSDDGRMFLGRVQASTAYMTRLIDDLLRLSRIGRTDATLTDVDLQALVEDIGRDIQERYPGKQVLAEAQVMLRMNAVRARQLFTNLIENAAVHGGRDNLTIEVRAHARTGRFVEVLVRDDGVGVPREYRERVFTIFERLDGFGAGGPGTGVGLTMCRRIVEDVSGSVEILDSEVGTLVRLILPESLPDPMPDVLPVQRPSMHAALHHA